MAKFFEDLKGKAQSAINSSSLGAYVPGAEQHGGAQSPQSSQGGSRSLALDTIQHQFRTLQIQYGSSASKDVRQLQMVITAQKGIVLDLEKQEQDSKTASKEFYTWGQDESSDIKDVSDRLAYLMYLEGTLAANLASSLNAARAPLKALRDAEAHLQPKRNIRAGYELQITRLKNEAKPGTEQKTKELQALLKKAEADDEPLEKEIELLKRKAIAENASQRWKALREYGEKLALLSQACEPFVEALPSIPPSSAHPYEGAASTAATRAALQKALDNYKTGDTKLPGPSEDREIRSFGETHAGELSRINSVADRPHVVSSPPQSPAVHESKEQGSQGGSAGQVGPGEQGSQGGSAGQIDPGEQGSSAGPVDPGEEGSPAGPVDPGKEGSPAGQVESTPDTGVSKQESAEEEKKRLEKEERERLLRGNESAEEEKKRLEREEREKVLRGGSGGNPPGSGPESGNGSNPPPYAERR